MPNMINMPSPVEAERAGWPLPITDRVISALSAWAVQVLSKDVLGQSFLFFFSLAASPVEGVVFLNVVGFIGLPHSWPLHDSCHCR